MCVDKYLNASAHLYKEDKFMNSYNILCRCCLFFCWVGNGEVVKTCYLKPNVPEFVTVSAKLNLSRNINVLYNGMPLVSNF